MGTSRRKNPYNPFFFYNILQSNGINEILANVSGGQRTAIICIAEANIDRCYEEYDDAYLINVIRTKELIHSLVESGFHVIYFSSDNVFDGLGGNYTEESLVHPVNKYGMMKAEMEQYLLENIPEVCILRISKVVSTLRWKQNIFMEWENQVDSGKIRCIRGNKLSFVWIDDIYQACRLAAENKLYGLYNIVGDQSYSRAELAAKFYDKMRIREMEICECDIDEFSFRDCRPLNLSMSNQKFKNETAYQFMNMNSAIELYLHEGNEVN